MSDECQKSEWKGKCCCNCKHHIQDFHHCTTLERMKSGCICDQPKGWICMDPEIGRAYSGWSEHGMCELHETSE